MISKQKTVVLDCDEVLLGYNAGLADFAKKYYNITPTAEHPTKYILDDWFGVDVNTIDEIISHFNYHSVEFGMLKPLDPYVVSAVHELKFKHNLDIQIVTKSGTLGSASIVRKLNLNYVFGTDVFSEIHIIEHYMSKRTTLQQIMKKHDVLCFVDDAVDNIKVGNELGLNTIMVEQPHNHMYHQDDKFKYWYDVKNRILELLHNSN